MEAIIEEVGFEGSFAEFLDFLRTDPQFFVDTPEDLLKEASFIAKQMDGKLPTYFKTLPRLPYGVAPVPDHIAPKYTAGRYVGAPLGSTQPGYYWVNTYALESRPLWALPALTLHEAVPGRGRIHPGQAPGRVEEHGQAGPTQDQGRGPQGGGQVAKKPAQGVQSQRQIHQAGQVSGM